MYGSHKTVKSVFQLSLDSVTSEEYQLLLRLNQMTVAKYSDMTSLAGRLNQVSEKLQEKCK